MPDLPGWAPRYLSLGSTVRKTDVQKYRASLEAKRDELAPTIRKREGITVENVADDIDRIRLAAERELAIRNLDRDSALLRDVKRALARIEDQTYGICLHCEGEIEPKRLEAVPWAAYCITCQNAVAHEPQKEEFEEGSRPRRVARTGAN